MTAIRSHTPSRVFRPENSGASGRWAGGRRGSHDPNVTRGEPQKRSGIASSSSALGHERGMNLVIFNTGPEQTARAQRLTQTDWAVIEESADGATPWTAGDTGKIRAFARDCGHPNPWDHVVKRHDTRPATFWSARPLPPPSRRPSSPSWALPRLHCFGTIDLAFRARKRKTCIRRAKSEIAERTAPFDSPRASRFLVCKVFRLAVRNKRDGERRKSLANGCMTRHPCA